MSRQFTPVLVLALFAAAPSCGTAPDDRPATWSYISAAIIEPNCATAGCHSVLAQAYGVVLYSREAGYVWLVDRDQSFVVPGDPTQSQLLYLLRGDQIRRMPPDSPLPRADVDLIERWILDGARDN